jgi:septin family protein
LELLKYISHRVNVIPVIAKADTLTKTELKNAKTRVMELIKKLEIPFYNFPVYNEEDKDAVEESRILQVLSFLN